jgi:hypothetical protein
MKLNIGDSTAPPYRGQYLGRILAENLTRPVEKVTFKN